MAEVHRFIVDRHEDDVSVIEIDGRTVLDVPRWLLPTGARRDDVLAVTVEAVHVTPLPPFVRYRLAAPPGPRGRLLRHLVEALRADPAAKTDREAAVARSRADALPRVADTDADAG